MFYIYLLILYLTCVENSCRGSALQTVGGKGERS